jgi:hypothetical protein
VSLTLEEHLELGKSSIKQIEVLRGNCEPVVCFHFSPSQYVDGPSLGYGTESKYWPRLERAFADLGIDGSIDAAGGEFGFEVYEYSWPSEDWLEERIPQMLSLGAEVEHEFQGWTFEPRGGPVISAAPDVGVWNADTPDGKQKIQELIEKVERSREAEADK